MKKVKQEMWAVAGSGSGQVIYSAGVLSLPLLFTTKREATRYKQYYGDRVVRVTIRESRR